MIRSYLLEGSLIGAQSQRLQIKESPVLTYLKTNAGTALSAFHSRSWIEWFGVYETLLSQGLKMYGA
jgi:hypothetical protein